MYNVLDSKPFVDKYRQPPSLTTEVYSHQWTVKLISLSLSLHPWIAFILHICGGYAGMLGFLPASFQGQLKASAKAQLVSWLWYWCSWLFEQALQVPWPWDLWPLSSRGWGLGTGWSGGLGLVSGGQKRTWHLEKEKWETPILSDEVGGFRNIEVNQGKFRKA